MSDQCTYIDRIPRSKNRDKRKFAKRLRKHSTLAEDVFKRHFQSAKARGLIPKCSLRSQRIFGPYVCDFLIEKYKIFIEIDGPIHDQRKEYDRRRESYIASNTGYAFMRFTNNDILFKWPAVIYRLNKAFAEFDATGRYTNKSMSLAS